ncbi:CbtB domain-containing protein [Methylococcus sp. ANG]|uniref:Uncharacterized protein n=1 Tax=Methylococcus capsulatus TaxID=414 RepID=A0AA35Y1A8_METCP|nr:CbtB domain-containing protein [Methylococcus capsulatus]CAI8839781.1 protein of unknown function [Methylococcus capsulatus]
MAVVLTRGGRAWPTGIALFGDANGAFTSSGFLSGSPFDGKFPMNARTLSHSSLIHVGARTAAIAAMALGGFLVLMVGFSPTPAVHNAAHDTRHSAAFPCH